MSHLEDISRHVRFQTLPKVCFAATDRVWPRWRFLMIMINGSSHPFRIDALRITQYAGPQRHQTTLSGPTLSQAVSQGDLNVAGQSAIVFDLQDPPTGRFLADRVKMQFICRSKRHSVVLTHSQPLIRSRTRYLDLPMKGPWVVESDRTDRHSAGIQFGFDLTHPQQWELHEHPPARAMTFDEFPSYGADVFAPAAGTIVHAENRRPDLPPTPGRAPFPDGPPPDDRTAILGNYILLQLDSSHVVLMAHLQKNSVCVDAGQRVSVGQRIARIGNSGNTDGPHLHIETLDRVPNWNDLGTSAFEASGRPFGFRLHKRARPHRPSRVVPRKHQIICSEF